jgi:hypothetical protein
MQPLTRENNPSQLAARGLTRVLSPVRLPVSPPGLGLSITDYERIVLIYPVVA